MNLHLIFGTTEYSVALPAGEPAWPADKARQWLDEQFVARECEPLRASGKVLTVDKLLAVATAIGARGFADAALQHDFARAATAATGKARVTIDADAGAVTF